ncbi:Dabb family protein [Sediminibacterium goheungense]|uniref:Stress responsive alpha/beta barrel protein n=1 Tax=Sediminibacterium goheungense TaxID=1086393 RepID=A0A4V3C4F2_9BACT|nr:Dabb family protein [Sediminibacterium goheungense]TDO25738.1 stress responsive alpha/beta barrel protein [Sediminibacterium goheungense]
MKKMLLSMACLICLTTGLFAQTTKKELRHVVLFGWKEKADTAAISKAVVAFGKLPGQISSIKKFEWGTNNSPEKLNNGLTHCFLLSFASEKDRDAYLVHPAHKAFTTLLPDILDKVTVVDYWVQQ